MSDASAEPHPRRGVPAVARLASVAHALGDDICARIVFVGASLLPLFETELNVISSPRPTKDVDAVTATSSYWSKVDLDERLRARGFKNVMDARHADQWRAPDGTQFDPVACGTHSGGTGNQQDQWAVDHADVTLLPPRIRHASAVGLLLLKCGAYRDRGANAPRESKDLADIATLVATRPALADELQLEDAAVQAFVGEQISNILNTRRAADALRSHIEDREPLFDGVADLVIARLRTMAGE